MGDYPCPCSSCWCGAINGFGLYEVKAAPDGLWLYLHGQAKEGAQAAINLTSIGGPIGRHAAHEVWVKLKEARDAQ